MPSGVCVCVFMCVHVVCGWGTYVRVRHDNRRT